MADPPGVEDIIAVHGMQPMVDPYKEAARRKAEAESTAKEVAVAQKVYLFHDFNEAMARLWKKYGVVEVAEQCRSWADYIDRVREINERHSDGPDNPTGVPL